jgi:hypothetical protein
MPKNHDREDEHLKKPVKLDSKSRNTYHFGDGADVQRYLQIQKQDSLTDGEVLSLFTERSVADCFSPCSPHRTS